MNTNFWAVAIAVITLTACGGSQTDNASSSGSSSGSSGSSSNSSSSSSSSSSTSSSTSSSSSSSSSNSSSGMVNPFDDGLVGWATKHPDGAPTGGAGGESCIVTNIAELKSCVSTVRKTTVPYTIYVKGHITATLLSDGSYYDRIDFKDNASNVSLIGLQGDDNSKPTLNGVYLVLTEVDNIIIRNIRFIAPREVGVSSPEGGCTAIDPDYCDWNAAYDAMTIQSQTKRVWLDHCEFTDGPEYNGINPFKDQYKQYDGLIDIKRGSDFITLSYNRFYNHDKMMLIGHSDGYAGDNFHVTFFRNYFEYIGQRAPRVRLGQVHLVNNLYENKQKVIESQKYHHQYAFGLGDQAQIYSEHNVFDIPGIDPIDLLGVGFDSWAQYFTDQGSWLNGVAIDLNAAAEQVINAREAEQNEGLGYMGNVQWTPADFYSYPVLITAEEVRNAVKSGAGVGKIKLD